MTQEEAYKILADRILFGEGCSATESEIDAAHITLGDGAIACRLIDLREAGKVPDPDLLNASVEAAKAIARERGA